MFTEYRKEIDWAGKKLVIETGKIARQSLGSVIATYGKTKVMANVTAAKSVNPDIDFFPLTVTYQEKMYAKGKIPGGYLKREGRPSERETLISRLIDRPLRPTFHPKYKNETQVVITVLQFDGENESDIVGMIAASAALSITGLPFLGPIGGVRIGYKNGEYTFNENISDMVDGELDLVVAGTKEGILMVESEAQELDEQVMLGALEKGHEECKKICDFIVSFAEMCAKEQWDIAEDEAWESDTKNFIFDNYEAKIKDIYSIKDKQQRSSSLTEIRSVIVDECFEKFGDDISKVKVSGFVKDLESSIVRNLILNDKVRIDGRKLDEVRNIASEVNLLDLCHGSALFTRGETQALVVTTLGAVSDEQMSETILGVEKSNFMLHYNFPPYSVGEVGRIGAAGRREIGHGKLASRAISPLLPSKDEFPYTIRVVSEIMESNGSSSMASVCGTSMSLMSAGVPIKSACAGIAMGLIKDGDNFAVLSDIMGDEDHLGDMDFKVAGTKDGITTMQMDIKITSITLEIMKEALTQAQKGRMHIMNEMSSAIETSSELSKNAPQMVAFNIDKNKIKEVIGSGGKVIKEIIETTGTSINIEDHGGVTIYGDSLDDVEHAKSIIGEIAFDPEVGKVYEAKVIKIVSFGAFVKFMGSKEGLVHISEFSDKRIENLDGIVAEGDELLIAYEGKDKKGKFKLTYKNVDQEKGVIKS